MNKEQHTSNPMRGVTAVGITASIAQEASDWAVIVHVPDVETAKSVCDHITALVTAPDEPSPKSRDQVEPLTTRLRFLRPTAKFRFAKDQYLLVGELMHEAASEIEHMAEELEVAEKLLNARNEVIDAIPKCKVHGSQCLPHALDWIKAKVLGETESRQQPISNQLAESIAERVLQGVCELPDYTSPDDQPNLLQCTVEELHTQVVNAVEACIACEPPRESNDLLLTESELRNLLRLPEALQLVIDGHHVNEAEADAIGEPGLIPIVRASESRRKTLEAARDALLISRGDKPGDISIVNGNDRVAAAPPAALSAIKHQRRVVRHVSGFPELMDTCICGEKWPCDKARAPTSKAEIIPRVELGCAASGQHAAFADSRANAGSTPAPGSTSDEVEILKRDLEAIRSQALKAGLIEVEVCLGCGRDYNACDCPAGSAKVLRRPTAEQSDIPFAWTIPGDDQEDMNGFIDTRITREGEFTKPLYARPDQQPAADRSKFDLAHEIMRQLATEYMITMQSRHCGYVLLVRPERNASPDISTLDEAAHHLAMLAIQSDRYVGDVEFRGAVDGVLDITLSDSGSFQQRALTWMHACFQRPDSLYLEQRSFRFLEEAIELGQSAGTSKDDVLRLVEYVYSRKSGAIAQEIGGVMVTLAGLASAAAQDVEKCAEAELQRCIANTEKIRAKDLAKPERSPLPGNTEVQP